MAVDEAPGLSGHQLLLQAAEQLLGLGERQAERLQPAVALVQGKDLLVVDDVTVVGDDPELDLEAHDPSHGRAFQVNTTDA
jgi:hypothetical protein